MGVFDAIGDRVVLVDLYPLDPDAEEVVWQGVSDQDYSTGGADTPANAEYDGFLLSLTWEQNLIAPGTLRGGSVGGRGAIRVGDPSRDDDVGGGKLAHWEGYRWQGRRFEVWLLPRPGDFADRVLVISGELGGLTRDDGDYVLPIRDLQERFRGDLQTNLYLGTGGFEGGDELKDKPKPLAWGINRNAEPVPSDNVNLWFDLHDGEIEEIIVGEVKVQGSALTVSGSNPPPGGHYYPSLSTGRLRLGTAPSGPLTVSFRGDASGAGYVSTMADIVRRILTTRGAVDDPDGLVAATFTALNAVNSAEHGWLAGTNRTSIAAAIDAVMGSDLGWWLPDALSLIRIGRLSLPTATEETAALVLDEHDIVRGSMRRRLVDTPPWRVRGLYRRYWRPLRGNEAVDASFVNRFDLAEEWRATSWEDPDVLAAWPSSQPLDLEILADLAAAALATVDRVGPILAAGLVAWEFETGLQPMGVQMADEIFVRHPDEGLASGKPLLLAGRAVDATAGVVRVEAWGI